MNKVTMINKSLSNGNEIKNDVPVPVIELKSW